MDGRSGLAFHFIRKVIVSPGWKAGGIDRDSVEEAAVRGSVKVLVSNRAATAAKEKTFPSVDIVQTGWQNRIELLPDRGRRFGCETGIVGLS
jgi:hypothetical protein